MSFQEFFEACRRGDVEKIKNYITNKKNKKPRTPLNFLRPATPSSGWLASSKDPSTHYTPLHYAALHGHHQACKILLGSDKLLSSARDRRGCVPLHLASWNGHFEAVKLLLETDPNIVDAVNNAQESPLHLAAQHGHDRLVRVLLENHADPRLRNARFETPLDVAARTGHALVCKILVGFCPELTLQVHFPAKAELASERLEHGLTTPDIRKRQRAVSVILSHRSMDFGKKMCENFDDGRVLSTWTAT
ncbi:hypothetical protein Y032_0398g717 [Ancylostoma ceylanicum]|uniref:Uncharacterized protein n=1 Tax=Ancylostoma ceylanicum TaxID=53326 RepID=A0A016RR06_9BILA|nr:hypothetical protein Y032_0398g717 [Ancylostoma ceylanicum]